MIEDIQDKVIAYFERSRDLRVLFFFDEGEEYVQTIDQIKIPGIHLVKWENNPFTLKVKLTDELKEEKVLLYLPMKHPSNQEEYHNFPLMGLLIANKDLQLDDTGDFIEEFNLGRHQKSLVEKYMSELKYSSVKEVCNPILKVEKLTEELLQQGILSANLKFNRIQSWPLLIAKLVTLILKEPEYNRVFKKIISLNLEEAICIQVQKLIGITIDDLSMSNLKTIGQALRYNQITQTISEATSTDPYITLKTTDQEKIIQLNQLLFMVETDKSLSNQFVELFNLIDKEIQGEKIIQIYGLEQEYGINTPSMLWAFISDVLRYLFEHPNKAGIRLEKLSLQDELKEEISAVLVFLSQSAKLINQISSVPTYILNTPEDYIQWYEQQGYLVDQYYRRSIIAKKQIDETEIPQTIDLNAILSKINEQYESHTDKINREWLKCLNEKAFDYSNINHPKQYDFYQTEIEKADQKVVIVISDALRYEAGRELLARMHADPKNTAEVRSMIASLPSKTNIGMAQLLPGKELLFNNGDISIDGIKSSGTENREEIIKTANNRGKAIQFSSLEGVSEKDRRELFKHELVYVYHDVIDSIGDRKISERKAFDAVTEAVKELSKFVKSLHASFAVSKVFITSDHGFLYSDNTIQDKNLEKIDDPKAISTHNRYFLSPNEVEQNLGYTFALSKTTKFKDELYVTIPKSVNRYRKQGVGHQFVHGGGSLQELITPLIESSRKRTDLSTKVSPQLISNEKLRVVSNILRVNILQKDPISRTAKEITLSIGLYDDLTLVSNEEIKLLNYTSDSPSERVLRIQLVLSANSFSTSFLKLKIFDVEDKLNPLIEEKVHNNTLIQPDF